MAKKTTKKPAKPQGTRKRATRPTVSAPATPVASRPTTAAAPAVQPSKPKPVARYRRASLTPAARRGSDLVRFLRIHAKKPFAKRGEEAIRRLAIEVGHLANVELGASAPVAEV